MTRMTRLCNIHNVSGWNFNRALRDPEGPCHHVHPFGSSASDARKGLSLPPPGPAPASTVQRSAGSVMPDTTEVKRPGQLTGSGDETTSASRRTQAAPEGELLPNGKAFWSMT